MRHRFWSTFAPWRQTWRVAAGGVLAAVALAGSACAKAPAPSSSSATVWLCRPGAAGDPCAFGNRATAVGPDGTRSTGTLSNVQSAATAAKFDCFYVYPTISEEMGANADLAIQSTEVDAAIAQASQFSQVCNVWAPMYRQVTLSTVESALADATKGKSILQSNFEVAYDSLLSAWNDFLAHHSDGRPFVLIGHSQGSAVLIHLIASQIDGDAALRRRLVVAIVPGGNLLVPPGGVVGGDFENVPLCTSPAQTGCAIAYSSYPAQPPRSSLFGRADQGANDIRPSPAGAGTDQVACVNPAALSGGVAAVTPYFLAGRNGGFNPPLSTVWVTYPQLYSVVCESADGASWLQVTDVAKAGDTRPVVTQTGGPTWGYHVDDINLVLGNLVRDVAAEENSWVNVNPGQ